MNSSLVRAVLALSMLPALILSCGQGNSVQVIEETRQLDRAPAPPTAVSSAERFGMRTPAAPAVAGSSALPFEWSVPEGWTEAPSSQMRLVNLVPGGDSRAECYLTVLPGSGGGVEANVNRWRNQMSLEPLSAEEFAALPKKPLLGEEAVYVEFDGVYKGMSGDQNQPDFKMVGLILGVRDSGVFVKMLGPKDLIDKELGRFHEFCESLKIKQAGTPAGSASEAHNHSEELALQWTAPEDWTKSPDRPMRAVTFTMGADGETECYVSVFPGDTGGLEANINRWAGQMGAATLDEAAIASLPKVSVLGEPAPLVEFSGHFTDTMNGTEIADGHLLGVVATHGGQSIFIKLVGPAAEVAAQKEKFIAFCESLRH
ncbi:MAG: hypothetical protein IT365_26530 [Candidatus Hydrogenedentes bacterium]|nr:hypothetical protein [Candidatus Hydrogenedentota bacterium]